MYVAKKFPINKWIGRYEHYVIYLYGGKSFNIAAHGLEKFFGHFTKAKYLHEFSVTDVTDYVNWRKSEGANERTLSMEIRAVRRMYSWLIDVQGYKGPNPCLAHSPLPDKSNKKSLSLLDLRRILSACSEPTTRDFILGQILGEVRLGGHSWTFHANRLREVHAYLGLYWKGLKVFRDLIRDGLWSSIIQQNHEKLCNAFLSESEIDSNAFRNIQVTPSNVRPPVQDSDLDFFMVDRVNEPNTTS